MNTFGNRGLYKQNLNDYEVLLGLYKALELNPKYILHSEIEVMLNPNLEIIKVLLKIIQKH